MSGGGRGAGGRARQCRPSPVETAAVRVTGVRSDARVAVVVGDRRGRGRDRSVLPDVTSAVAVIVSRLGRRVVALVLLVDGARLVLLVLAGFAIGRWRGRGLAAMPGVAIGQVDADEVGDV